MGLQAACRRRLYIAGRPPSKDRLLPASTFQPTAACLALALALVSCGGGGAGAGAAGTAPGDPSSLSAADLAVLIAEGDATSEAIGRAYQLARGVPEANMIRVAVDGRADAIGADAFNVLKAAIDARLPAAVQATLVTWTRPSRVMGACSMGLSSALALGYEARYCGGCVATPASAYYNSNSRQPWAELRIRPSMMLGAATLAEATALIARGLAAEGQQSAGGSGAQGWLVRTSDAGRSVRFDDFVALAATPTPGLTLHVIDNSAGTGSDAVFDQRNILFYFTGLTNVPQIATNTYLPGAVADHLTSYAGLLPDGLGQMTVLDWLQAGLTGSYGTVEEPCNYPQKFPRASVLVERYRRGDTLIEAYWKSVQWPGQGLFVGEPLARPWAR